MKKERLALRIDFEGAEELALPGVDLDALVGEGGELLVFDLVRVEGLFALVHDSQAKIDGPVVFANHGEPARQLFGNDLTAEFSAKPPGAITRARLAAGFSIMPAWKLVAATCLVRK